MLKVLDESTVSHAALDIRSFVVGLASETTGTSFTVDDARTDEAVGGETEYDRLDTEVCVGLTKEIDEGANGCCTSVTVRDAVVDSPTVDEAVGTMPLPLIDVLSHTSEYCVTGSDL
jgi:hypothetical protein